MPLPGNTVFTGSRFQVFGGRAEGMIQADVILSEIRKHGVTHVVGVPDNGSRALYRKLWDDPGIRVVPVAREGEAFAVASGLSIGGKKPLVLIQNTGFYEAGDAFRGTVVNMAVPLVMIVGYRGYNTMFSAGEADTAATFFEPVLKAWNVPYTMLRTSEDSGLISEAFSRCRELSRPVAVIYAGEMD
jgi:sulfopyruvate decarboxylase TPP-binding subunit